MPLPALLHATATRYVQPLREGGSLPAVVDTDAGLFVVKFRGAGQGPRALVAELIVGLLAQALGLPMPELALVDVPPTFGRSEPDPEIQDLLRASHGTNVGIRYLDGAFNFSPQAAADLIDGQFASRLVWLDAFVTNPDRTDRNPNMLVWQRRPWLIDHGAALYAHYDWPSVSDERIRGSFPIIRQHVLLRAADGLAAADAEAAAVLTPELLADLLTLVPDSILDSGDATEAPDSVRARYHRYLVRRLEHPREFAAMAARARDRELATVPTATPARR